MIFLPIIGAGVVMVFVLVLLAVIVVGIRQESPTNELPRQAPSPLAALVRQLVGVYIRKPDRQPIHNQQRGAA